MRILGFRKFSAYVQSINPDTTTYFVTTGNLRNFGRVLKMRDTKPLQDEDIEQIARGVAQCDILGFSSMTQYAPTVIKIIEAVRKLNPDCYLVWGGIHPIIEPEDAIKHADAVCTGEGEFAFEQLLKTFKEGGDVTNTPSFWFRTPDGIKKNKNFSFDDRRRNGPLAVPDGEGRPPKCLARRRASRRMRRPEP